MFVRCIGAQTWTALVAGIITAVRLPVPCNIRVVMKESDSLSGRRILWVELICSGRL